MAESINLTKDEIARVLAKLDPAKYSPVSISPAQLAELLGYPRATIYEWVAKGYFDGTFRKRGKGIRFWADRAIARFFNGPEWQDEQ